jgi:hypothetical protein
MEVQGVHTQMCTPWRALDQAASSSPVILACSELRLLRGRRFGAVLTRPPCWPCQSQCNVAQRHNLTYSIVLPSAAGSASGLILYEAVTFYCTNHACKLYGMSRPNGSDCCFVFWRSRVQILARRLSLQDFCSFSHSLQTNGRMVPSI